MNAAFVRNKEAVSSLVDVLLIVGAENECSAGIFSVLFELFAADPTLARVFLGMIADLTKSIKNEANSQ